MNIAVRVLPYPYTSLSLNMTITWRPSEYRLLPPLGTPTTMAQATFEPGSRIPSFPSLAFTQGRSSLYPLMPVLEIPGPSA